MTGTFDEQRRLDALERYDILDTLPSPAFDRVTRLAQRMLGMPITTVSFIDGHRQWFKSRIGVQASETPRDIAFCNLTIQGDGPLVVADARNDPRFSDNPLVTGAPHIGFYAGVPMRTPDGQNIGSVCVIDTKPREIGDNEIAILEDLAALVMQQLELMRLANRDSLTGLLSRAAFREEAGRAIVLARRHNYPLACLGFDLDHFKRVNDTFGHAAGDLVLRETAALCRQVFRTSDVVGRVGGEEFVALLPHAGPSQARDVAERVRAAIAGHAFVVGDNAIQVTTSIGVAALGRDAETLDALLERADFALYRAKANGRDCVDDGGAKENRRAVRSRVLKGARIVFNGRRSVIDCTIKNLSERGAGLDVSNTVGIPAGFTLEIPVDAAVRQCRVMWRGERRLGVSFDDVPRR